MLTVLASIAFLLTLGLGAGAIAATVIEGGDKILAALAGRSILAQPVAVRPVTVRFSPRYPTRTLRPVPARAALRVAA
jgi:hypothetical protein